MQNADDGEHKPWYIGTCALIGLAIGVMVGFSIKQVPFSVGVALAAGVGLDAWLYNRSVR